ncbi:MAG: hypothetical protein QMD65_02055 [Patescibacteria group bacterium]|nr:hypothetical protein [Patescibacteria group bacterium]
MKENTLAQELTAIALRQLTTGYQFKLPRINQIRRFRDLYNGKTQRQLRIRYNVPIPIFAGMIDTLQADLDDQIILKYEEQDPADWKAAIKANAALKKEIISMRPGAKWNEKLRGARQECIMTGRGILKLTASNEDGFETNLEDLTFEDFYFEPKGGRNLESHLFCGQSNIWKSKKELQNEAGGIYDARQVKRLLDFAGGNTYRRSSHWDNCGYANRFASLDLSSESNNYVGEEMFHLIEWCLTYKGERWYLLFDAFVSEWVRFEKLTDIHSSGYYPWVSFASHPDKKNFATKGFADDLYPIAIASMDLFNEDLENKKRRNSNARAYDKDMFPNVAQLDEAQMGRDRLVETDTKGGTRRISEGIYAFETPEISGTLDTVSWLENLAGKSFGVTDIQQGVAQPASKRVGVAYAELSQISKRLSFTSQPIIEAGQELGMRYFGALKDYLREPLSIKILGEEGYEWDTLKRIDLNTKKGFEISVTSQAKENKMNELSKQNKLNALQMVRNTPPANPGVNTKIADEYTLRDVGGYSEAEIALLLDPNSQADKRTIAETSEAIQNLMLGKMPDINYNATAYFLQKILDFVKTHKNDAKIRKNEGKFMAYLEQHTQIAMENEARRAKKDAMAMQGNMPIQTTEAMPQDQSMQINPQTMSKRIEQSI